VQRWCALVLASDTLWLRVPPSPVVNLPAQRHTVQDAQKWYRTVCSCSKELACSHAWCSYVVCLQSLRKRGSLAWIRAHGPTAPEAIAGHNRRVGQTQQAVALGLFPHAVALLPVQRVPQRVDVQGPLPDPGVCDTRQEVRRCRAEFRRMRSIEVTAAL
jgi:hypothetical protein